MKAKMLNVVNGAALTVAGLITAINPSPAYADDTKIYPGLTCIRESGSGGTPGQWAGGITNTSSNSRLDLRCPVTRDVVSRNFKGGWMRAMDRNGDENQDVKCTLVAARLNEGGGGHTFAFSPELKTAGDTGTAGKLHAFNGFTGVVTADSHYEYDCSIPPVKNGNASMLSSYSVIENGRNE